MAESQKGSDSFHTARAMNTAIRWSRGQYVLVSNPDQLVTRAGLDALLRMLREDIAIPADMTSSLMLVPRVQVPWQFVQRQPDLQEWERYLFYNEFALRAGIDGLAALCRSLWWSHDARGSLPLASRA